MTDEVIAAILETATLRDKEIHVPKPTRTQAKAVRITITTINNYYVFPIELKD